jgi:hypothetical protein
MKLWDALKQPPPSALKTIQAGRLKGKSDINPQWRYQALTEQFGPCGVGWSYTIDRMWIEPAPEGQMFVFAQISLKIGEGTPMPAVGGSMLIQKESSGLHANDEGYKMAVTDALGTAMKMIGVAADVYMGKWDGSKYQDAPKDAPAGKQTPPPPTTGPAKKSTSSGLSQRDKQTAIKTMLVEIYINDKDAEEALLKMTTWEKDGVVHEGKRSSFELNMEVKPGKKQSQTDVYFHEVKKLYDGWKTAQEKEAQNADHEQA